LKKSANDNKVAGLQSVIRTFEIVEYLAQNNEAGITELSNDLGQSKSTTYRFLSTLKSLGYVRQNRKNDKYTLSHRLFEISSKAMGHNDTITVARPILEQLANESCESVHLSVLERNTIVYIDKIDSAYSLRMFSHIGRSAPAHCTAMGKALLAYQPESFIDELFSNGELRAYTANTITDKDKLKKSLTQIRRRGVAVDNEEYEDGLKCVAAPIRDYNSGVIASFCVAGPSIRLRQSVIKRLKEQVAQASEEISRRLGFRARA